MFNGSDWNVYPISETAKDFIIEHVLDEKPDFNQLNLLTKKLEKETLKFIKTIEAYINL